MAFRLKLLTTTLAVAATALILSPMAEAQSTFPVEAGSWGGKVRTGPGSSFKQVAGLKEGDTVKILEDTGVQMNGFPWFKIEFDDGKTGYKWGGVLCSRKVQVKGTFRQCEGYVASEQPTPAKPEQEKEPEVAAEEPPKAEPEPEPETEVAETKPADEPKAITVEPDTPEEAKPEAETTAEADEKPEASPELKWAYKKFKDEANQGKSASTLTVSAADSNDVLIQGYCSVGFKENVSVLKLSSETGDLEEAASVKVAFTGNNKDHAFDGTVVAKGTNEPVSGARITVKNDDALWETLQELPDIDYQVNSFKSVPVSLSGATDPILNFLADCTSYAGSFDEEPSVAATETAPPAPQESTTAKEAFETALETNTLEGWQAYLRDFPQGVRSDLARAYVKRLQGGDQAAAAPPDAEPEVEETVNLGPGTASWRPFKYAQDEGNASSPAAGVEANGLELLAYCSPKKRVSAILREKKRGVYPDFDGRVERGLKALEAAGASLPLSFDTGSKHSVPASVAGLTGEVAIGDASKGFSAASRIVRDLMSANQVTLSAPPFAASFQLKGSRRALCSMLKSCGVKSAECARYEPARSVNVDPQLRPKQQRQQRQRRARCPRRYVYLEGECVHRRYVAEYCGPGYRRQGSRCVRRRYRVPSYDVCPPGFFYEFGRCVAF
ncbi:MAG: SH3 domain-containing protein [Pseudomonadota bacterium]